MSGSLILLSWLLQYREAGPSSKTGSRWSSEPARELPAVRPAPARGQWRRSEADAVVCELRSSEEEEQTRERGPIRHEVAHVVLREEVESLLPCRQAAEHVGHPSTGTAIVAARELVTKQCRQRDLCGHLRSAHPVPRSTHRRDVEPSTLTRCSATKSFQPETILNLMNDASPSFTFSLSIWRFPSFSLSSGAEANSREIARVNTTQTTCLSPRGAPRTRLVELLPLGRRRSAAHLDRDFLDIRAPGLHARDGRGRRQLHDHFLWEASCRHPLGRLLSKYACDPTTHIPGHIVLSVCMLLFAISI